MRDIWIVSLFILFHRIHGQTMELIAGHVVSSSKEMRRHSHEDISSYFDMVIEHRLQRFQRIQ